MTKLILRNPGTNKNNQRKNQTHMQQTHKHRPKGKTQNTVSQHSSFQKTRFQETGDPTIVIHQYTKRFEWTSSESAMRCDDIDDMKLKCHVTTQHTLQFMRQRHTLFPGPWPSIPDSLLPNQSSEQAQEQAAEDNSKRQQTRAEDCKTNLKTIIYYI